MQYILNIFSATTGKKTDCFKFGIVYTYEDWNTKLKKWMVDSGFTMFIRSSEKFHALLNKILSVLSIEEKPILIYSMWDGYVNRTDKKRRLYTVTETLCRHSSASYKRTCHNECVT